MAELTDVQKTHINTQVASWVAQEFARAPGDGSASTPLTNMLQEPLNSYKASIASLPAEKQSELLKAHQKAITEQLQNQMIAGAEKGGSAQALEKNLTKSQEPTEQDQQISMYKNLLNIGSQFIGGIGQTLISIVTNLPFFGDMIGNLIDSRDPVIKDREKMAAGAASGIKIISFDNTNISADAGTRLNISNALNASLEHPEKLPAIPEVPAVSEKPKTASPVPAEPAERAPAPANAEPAAAPEAPKQGPAPAAPQAPRKAPLKIDIRKLVEADINGDGRVHPDEFPAELKEQYAALLKSQPKEENGNAPESINLGNFVVQTIPTDTSPLAFSGKQR